MPHANFPAWLHTLSIVSLLLAGGCAVLIAIDVARHPQKMTVMKMTNTNTKQKSNPNKIN